jgi:hypothetical protein
MIQIDRKWGQANARILEFEGMREMVAYGHEALPLYTQMQGNARARDQWAGATTQETLDVVEGRKVPKELERVNKLLTKIDATFRDRETASWEPDVAGAYPVVPEALQGMPECMRSRQHVESDNAPLRIYVDMFVSGSVANEDVTRRGIAIAALAIRLAETRPVELWVCCLGGSKKAGVDTLAWRYRLPVNTASASEVTAAIATSYVLRQFGFCVFGQHDGEYNAVFPRCDAGTLDKARALFDLDPADIFLPGFASSSGEFKDPEQWVNNRLRDQRKLYE